MERLKDRMYAYATKFDEIHVFLSENYYNGVSPTFFIKDHFKSTLMPLNGDALEESSMEGYKEYRFKAKFKVGRVYKISDAYGLTCHLNFERLSLCEDFDKKYYYPGNDLGPTYTKRNTTFKLWAPTSTGVLLKLIHGESTYIYEMQRDEKGVYSYTVKGDLEGYEYLYLVKMVENYRICLDPYAYSSTANSRTSIVVDLNKVKPKTYELPKLKKKTDAIIYETSVRDFSSHKNSGMENKGKFLAFTETNTKSTAGNSTGLDYLKELGITHVQLMPINDFATVDEMNTKVLYNWGYDPAQYNVTEGSYVTDPEDGYKRIKECQMMVNSLHSKGIRVVLDVVYNHMHSVNNNALECSVPYYFFRRDEEGNLSNGSWCGNDLNSTAKMCQKYILDMCKRWQELYGIDGYRFDLMGIIDQSTMKKIYAQGKKIDPSFIVYGEGWNMGTALEEEKRTIIDNNAMVPEIGFFNDYFRDTMRGNNSWEDKGYISGNTYKTNDAIKAICNYEKFAKITQSINYIECHDNAVTYDKLGVSNPEESHEIRKKRLQMGLAMVILSQGIPFIHSGQEFFRTKNRLDNTYNAGDFINGIDWDLRDENKEYVDFVKFLIELRKNNEGFRYDNYEDMQKHIIINNYNHRMVEYHVNQKNGQYKNFIIYMNASLENMEVYVEEDYELLWHTSSKTINDHHLMIEGADIAILARGY